jgi:hypothetical protein
VRAFPVPNYIPKQTEITEVRFDKGAVAFQGLGGGPATGRRLLQAVGRFEDDGYCTPDGSSDFTSCRMNTTASASDICIFFHGLIIPQLNLLNN